MVFFIKFFRVYWKAIMERYYIVPLKQRYYRATDRYLRIWRFLKLYSEKYPSLVQYYGGYVSYHTWFESIIPDLIELGKTLSKVRHKTNKNKKSRRCIRVCYSIMLWMMMRYSSILQESGVIRFEQLVQKLYGFDQEMALLLRNIVFDIVRDERFKHLTQSIHTSQLRLFFGIFFGKWIVSSFSTPKNLSFYLNIFSAQCICAQSNPRKRLLTTSGWVNKLLLKFGSQMIFRGRNPND